MLASMRSAAGHPAIKIFIVLLALSFVIWGIGDMFKGSSVQLAAKAGEKPISEQAVQAALKDQINSFRQLFGGAVPEELIVNLGLRRQAIDMLVQQAILEQEAARLHLDIDDIAVKHAIRNDARFHNPDGAFDRVRFQQLISKIGYSEKMFAEMIRSKLAVERLQGVFNDLPVAAEGIVELAQRYNSEERTATVLECSPLLVTESPKPDDAALLEFYNARQEDYKTPEYRTLNYLAISLGTMPQEEAAKHSPEDDFYAMANAVEDKLAAGATLQEAAAHVGVSVVELGPIDRNGMGKPETENPAMPELEHFLETAFATAEGETSSMQVTSNGGYFILQVTHVESPRQRTLDEVREQVQELWAAQQRQQRLQEKAEAIAASLKSGASAKTIAAETPGVTLREVTLTRQMRSNDADSTIAPRVFALSGTGDTPLVTEPVVYGGSYLIARLEGIRHTKTESATLQTTRQQLQEQMRDELFLQYIAYLRKNAYPVTYYNTQLETQSAGEPGMDTVPSELLPSQ